MLNFIFYSDLYLFAWICVCNLLIFLNLKKEEKCVVLSEILHLFQCQSTSANLKMIDGPGKAGILVMNNNISKCNKISIINQSPTGIFENEIDLLKI